MFLRSADDSNDKAIIFKMTFYFLILHIQYAFNMYNFHTMSPKQFYNI